MKAARLLTFLRYKKVVRSCLMNQCRWSSEELPGLALSKFDRRQDFFLASLWPVNIFLNYFIKRDARLFFPKGKVAASWLKFVGCWSQSHCQAENIGSAGSNNVWLSSNLAGKSAGKIAMKHGRQKIKFHQIPSIRFFCNNRIWRKFSAGAIADLGWNNMMQSIIIIYIYIYIYLYMGLYFFRGCNFVRLGSSTLAKKTPEKDLRNRPRNRPLEGNCARQKNCAKQTPETYHQTDPRNRPLRQTSRPGSLILKQTHLFQSWIIKLYFLYIIY